jgi:hypothetical protein
LIDPTLSAHSTLIGFLSQIWLRGPPFESFLHSYNNPNQHSWKLSCNLALKKAGEKLFPSFSKWRNWIGKDYMLYPSSLLRGCLCILAVWCQFGHSSQLQVLLILCRVCTAMSQSQDISVMCSTATIPRLPGTNGGSHEITASGFS